MGQDGVGNVFPSHPHLKEILVWTLEMATGQDGVGNVFLPIPAYRNPCSGRFPYPFQSYEPHMLQSITLLTFSIIEIRGVVKRWVITM